MSRGLPPAWRLLVPLIAALWLPACLVIVSTGLTPIANATLVFVAVDDRGALVASLHVSVVAVDTAWRQEGLTAADGAFRCNLASGATRVRVGVVPPPGYVLAGEQAWPRDIDVSPDGSRQTEVRIRRAGAP